MGFNCLMTQISDLLTQWTTYNVLERPKYDLRRLNLLEFLNIR